MPEGYSDRGLTLAPLLRRAGSVIESEIRGRSMAGTLPDQARIRIACGDVEAYRPGIVIAFVTPGGVVGHRVVGVSRRGGQPLFYTRGDRTVVCDGPVTADRVLGEVTEWNDGSAWQPVPAAPPLGPTRRVAAGLVLALVRLTGAVSIGAAGELSRVLLRLAFRDRAGPGRTVES